MEEKRDSVLNGKILQHQTLKKQKHHVKERDEVQETIKSKVQRQQFVGRIEEA